MTQEQSSNTWWIGHYPGHTVNEFGVVQSCHYCNGKDGPYRPMKGTKTPKGYIVVTLHDRNGKEVKRRVHQLVMASFLGPRPDPHPTEGGYIPCHEDGDPANNAASNLYWGTHAQNMRDREKHGRTARGQRIGSVKLRDELIRVVRSRIRDGESQRSIARSLGVCQATISAIHVGRTWSYLP